MPRHYPEKDRVNFIAIKKHKVVAGLKLLPYVYDSYLLSYGCPAFRPKLLTPIFHKMKYKEKLGSHSKAT